VPRGRVQLVGEDCRGCWPHGRLYVGERVVVGVGLVFCLWEGGAAGGSPEGRARRAS
jgi:hypothetical protein